jgi:hypothetical protein
MFKSALVLALLNSFIVAKDTPKVPVKPPAPIPEDQMVNDGFIPRRTDSSYYKDNKGQMHLKVDKNGEYRIMQLTDLHFGESNDRD